MVNFKDMVLYIIPASGNPKDPFKLKIEMTVPLFQYFTPLFFIILQDNIIIVNKKLSTKKMNKELSLKQEGNPKGYWPPRMVDSSCFKLIGKNRTTGLPVTPKKFISSSNIEAVGEFDEKDIVGSYVKEVAHAPAKGEITVYIIPGPALGPDQV